MNACFVAYAFTRAALSFALTATPTNCTVPAYCFTSDMSCGSSARQFSHHVAQNSITTGPLPMYAERFASWPSSVCTTAAGAGLPTGIPSSPCCAAAVPAAAIIAIAPKMFRIM